MTARIHNLFVYGTLMEDSGHEMYHVLARNAVFVGEGTVAGALYDLGRYPGLVPDESVGSRVKGEVYELQEGAAAATLATLDDYEGMGPEDPVPHEYRRQLVDVSLADGRRVKAWAYVLNKPATGLRRIAAVNGVAEWRTAI